MDLKTYLKDLSDDAKDALATGASTTVGHLRNIVYGFRQCSPELASALERESKSAVMRWDLRPDDWHLIWPELVKRKDAPATPAKAEA